MTPRLATFLAELDVLKPRVPLDLLLQRLHALVLTCHDVRRFIVFGDDRYRRNLMHAGAGFQALVLCWRCGQRSPIHDHEGSTCGVRVLRGVATETVFDRSREGRLVARAPREWRAGMVCGSQDDDIHEVANLQPDGDDLITLHIYSPPLLTMNTYSLENTSTQRFEDPVYEFIHGAGI